MSHSFTKQVLLIAFFAAVSSHVAIAQQQTQQQRAFDLLNTPEKDPARLVIRARHENGMYSLSYAMKELRAGAFCPRGGDLTVPVDITTEIQVTSADRIFRWVIPEANFDVTAIPGRIEVRRVTVSQPGRYQVQPPPGNTEKISDTPMNVLSDAEFKAWFKNLKPCR
jgi:heme/copper-type cytochrome/quinol oxidase subunit 2